MRCLSFLFTFAAAVTGMTSSWQRAQAAGVAPNRVDLTNAVIVTPPQLSALEQKAVTVLREEIQRRTGLMLAQSTAWPEGSGPVIAVGLAARAKEFGGAFTASLSAPEAAEGYTLRVERSPRPVVLVVGRDTRGLLFGVGGLLRKLEFGRQAVAVPASLKVATAPKYPLRGFQLGYRPKVNAYDAWTVQQFDQYIRELALFGSNSIELLPPHTDDARTNALMKIPPPEMMERLADVVDSYGLDVWLWLPNMGKDYATEAGITRELKEREDVFRRLKRLDHILIPGGDPGFLEPDIFFAWADRLAGLLKRHHPNAKIWVSPQAFEPTDKWLESFYQHVNRKPAWLGGIVFAPWVRTPLPQMRQIVDRSIPIRDYPDITHNLQCQYPVPDWDLAFALTLHRECYNPRPMAMKTIQNRFGPLTCGAVAYSEGINDDVNKFVWSDQQWDPRISVVETLRDYGRLFIDSTRADEIAQALLALEENWRGPLAINEQIDVTLGQWQKLERLLGAQASAAYRFQMGLLRANYDAYVKRRLIYEAELEQKALEVLRREGPQQPDAAMDKAEAILAEATLRPVGVACKQRCEELADALFAAIGSQLTVKRHQAQSRTRGAFMDGIDEPLNNARWLRAQFRAARNGSANARAAAILQILDRTDPGPGGFYDNLTTPGGNRRVVSSVSWNDDPGTLQSPRKTFYYTVDIPEDAEIPLAWKQQVRTVYAEPLHLVYENLEPEATYSIKATYSGRTSDVMRLIANGQYVVATAIKNRKPIVQEFPIPAEATRSGRLDLVWSCGDGHPGVEVAEVWLIKQHRPGAISSLTR